MTTSKIGPLILIPLLALTVFLFTSCSYLKEQAYERLDQEHATQVSQALDWLQETTQLLQIGSFADAASKAKSVQVALQTALRAGQESLTLASELYDEWVTTFISNRQELEVLYLNLAQAIEQLAVALKSGDRQQAQDSLKTIGQLKDQAATLLGQIEELQKLRQETAKLLVPQIKLPENLGKLAPGRLPAR